jgi:hypothetical protein
MPFGQLVFRVMADREALLDPTPPSVLAAQFVKKWRHMFDGWPGTQFYVQEEHKQRLEKVRHMLPPKLQAIGAYNVWGYLTAAVNDARARERKAYLKQVNYGADHMGES